MIPVRLNPVIDEGQSGSFVVLRPSDAITIRLPYHSYEADAPTKQWFLINDGAPVLQLLDSSPIQTPGGLGTHQWRFVALAEGTVVINIGYKESWLDRPERGFTLTVKSTKSAKPYGGDAVYEEKRRQQERTQMYITDIQK